MSNLEKYIAQVAQHGNRKIAVHLTGADINMKVLCHSLRWRVADYVGRGRLRYVWFTVSDGVVLLVSGDKIVTEVVEKHLAGYLDDSQELAVLFHGRGVVAFKDVVAQQLAGYDRSGRSFGATR
ncbi:hypothetical protein ACVWYU_001722 [Pseudomonas sp. TE12234]